MKEFFNFIAQKAKYAWASGILALAPMVAKAQSSKGSNTDIGTKILEDTKTKLSGMISAIGDVLRIVIGIGGLVALVMVIVNIMKGEREAASKAAYWLIGLVFGFIAITIVVNQVVKI